LFINLTPSVPLSLVRRGGRDFGERGFAPLPTTPPSLKEGDEVLA